MHGELTNLTVNNAQLYYQALALEKLGQAGQAKTIFTGLVDSGKAALQSAPAPGGGRGGRGARAQTPRARMANGHYLAGLGYLGLNDPGHAKVELTQAVETSPDLVGARVALGELQ